MLCTVGIEPVGQSFGHMVNIGMCNVYMGGVLSSHCEKCSLIEFSIRNRTQHLMFELSRSCRIHVFAIEWKINVYAAFFNDFDEFPLSFLMDTLLFIQTIVSQRLCEPYSQIRKIQVCCRKHRDKYHLMNVYYQCKLNK